MPEPFFTDDAVTLYLGDALATLRELPDASVDCCVTSPPYFGLRDYGVAGQYGLEASPADFVQVMRDVFAEVRRVLAEDGTLWLNLGDSYYSGRGNPGPNAADKKQPARRGWTRAVDRPGQDWSSPKNLLGMPWRVAFALQDDGWILRNAIIWDKPNAMPESIQDRLANRYEHLFLFSKSRRYWFDLDPIREDRSEATMSRYQYEYSEAPGRYGTRKPGANKRVGGMVDLDGLRSAGKNPGDVWRIPTVSFADAHFATFPPELARRCIAAGCKPDGVVLDPFSGSGTSGLVAGQLGRRYVGIDISAEYLNLSIRTRLAQGCLIDPPQEGNAT